MDLTTEECSTFLRDTSPRPVWVLGRGTRITATQPMIEVSAPQGIRSFVPEEMTLTCGAGTSVDEVLEVLGRHAQYVNLPVRPPDSGTVGGALAVGEGDIYRLGRGAVRDVLLQATFVDAGGTVVKVGGPTVKNVSGFDLCRLLVGSCGRIGIITEVILRTRPRPMATRWWEIEEADRSTVSMIMQSVRKPSCVLWSGTKIFLCVEGHPQDLVETEHRLRESLHRPLAECSEPSLERFPHRWLCSPLEMEELVTSNECLVEIGTGVVHHQRVRRTPDIAAEVGAIEKRILSSFDPMDRLNGGSRLWGRSHTRNLSRSS